MSLSSLPLSYCTNVHPGLTVAEVVHGLDNCAARITPLFAEPVAAGLWLAAPVIAELETRPAALGELRDCLARGRLTCHTLNAFPFGNFHDHRVKEQVYLPDWSAPSRLEYTLGCARILAALLPEGTEGSISTLPLGFKPALRLPGHREQCLSQLLAVAKELAVLEAETGRTLRLALEPEPLCLVETTTEATTFFAELFAAADRSGQSEPARHHLGLCYDVCHQAVEFEDITASFQKLVQAGVRINKLHITNAIELRNPRENQAGRQELAPFAEPRYLHQVFARLPDGRTIHQTDLTPELALHPPAEFLDATEWRVHFHVPIDKERLGALHTTRLQLAAALAATARLDYAPHLEVETYTWPVIPHSAPTSHEALATGLLREMQATRLLLQAARG